MPPLRHKERGFRTGICVSYTPLSLADQVRCNAVFLGKGFWGRKRKRGKEYRKQNSENRSQNRRIFAEVFPFQLDAALNPFAQSYPLTASNADF
jgi:hypothetical protein